MSQNGSLNYGAVAMQIREAAAKEERERLRPLLERCLNLAEGLAFNHPQEVERHFAADPILADLSRELGLPEKPDDDEDPIEAYQAEGLWR